MPSRITVITPSYNQAPYLEQAITSVLDQGYGNLEYFVLDGGSTDGSGRIIRKYEDRIDYWRSAKDGGQTAAINEGMKRAAGDIVGWLNSDDVLEKGALEAVAEAFASHPEAGIVCGRLLLIDARDNVLGERFNGGVTYSGLLDGRAQVNQPGSFYRTRLVRQVGYLDEGLNYAMDYDLWLRLAEISGVLETDRPLARHRLQEHSKTCAEYFRFLPEIRKIRRKHHAPFCCRMTWNLVRCELGAMRRRLFV
jgi:glycosyltransferase involved in cell wall biosynthesis